jgi:hypothetical protein
MKLVPYHELFCNGSLRRFLMRLHWYGEIVVGIRECADQLNAS